jgi:hypothetical protein
MTTASANSLTAFDPQYWANEMQEVFFKENVALSLANTELREVLDYGTRVHKPYRSYPWVTDYTKGTDITVKDRSSTNEYLDVDQVKIVPFYVDDLDQLHNKWDTASVFAQDAMKQLNNVLDQAVLSEYSNAGNDIYLADIGGSGATTAIPLDTSNVQDIFTAAARKIDQTDAKGEKFACVGPRLIEILRRSVAGRETGFGDSVGDNGLIAKRFGFNIYQSNNIPFTATLTTSAAIGNAETVTINGCTFTFKDSTTGAAGEVYSGGNDADTTDQLVAAINGTAGNTATTYYEPTSANRKKLLKAGIVATDGTTSITITGFGDIAVSETMAQGANVWSVQQSHLLFGMKGAIDLVVPKYPTVVFNRAELRLGRYVLPWMNYGKKTFADGAEQLVAVHLDASSWV